MIFLEVYTVAMKSNLRTRFSLIWGKACVFIIFQTLCGCDCFSPFVVYMLLADLDASIMGHHEIAKGNYYSSQAAQFCIKKSTTIRTLMPR